MTSTQELFLAELKAKAEADDLRLVLDFEYANRGTLHLLDKGLDPVDGRIVRFDFQHQGAHFYDATAPGMLLLAWYNPIPARQAHPTNSVSGCCQYLYDYLLRGEL